MHPLAEGVMVMVAVALVDPALVAVNEGMFPVPLAARPMEVSLLVQVIVVPLTTPLSGMMEVAVPLQ